MGCATSTYTGARDDDIIQASSKAVETKDEALETARRFTIDIEKDEYWMLGVTMKYVEDGLLICIVSENGAIAKWNANHPTLEVRPGDKIVGINGITDEIWRVTDQLHKHGTTCELLRTGDREVVHRSTETGHQIVLASELMDGCCGLQQITTIPDGDSMCAICMDESDDPSLRFVQLPCGHVFHSPCIVQWFRKGRHRCPLCNHSSENGVVLKLSSTTP